MNTVRILFVLYAIEWYQMKEQIMKFCPCIAYNASIYCVTLTAPSFEMAKMTPLISDALCRPRSMAVDGVKPHAHYVMLADDGPAS